MKLVRAAGRGAAVLWLAVLAACSPLSGAPIPAARAPAETSTPRAAPPSCASTDPARIAACVEPDRWADDLRFIAQARPPGSTHHLRVQSRCAEVFEAWGYEIEIDRYATGTNVLGTRPGRDPELPYVLVGAHYDHVPGCPGADDNASGTAAVLELARVLAGVPAERTLRVACWDQEEWGLVGSRDWAKRARARGDEILLYVNFDAIAYTDPTAGSQRVPTGFGILFPDEVQQLEEREGRADFIAVIADPRAASHARRFATYAGATALPAVVLEIPALVQDSGLAWDLQRSDHAALWDAGYPALMITDTADFRSDAYHCRRRPDAVSTLDLPFGAKVVAAAAALGTELVTQPAPVGDPPVGD